MAYCGDGKGCGHWHVDVCVQFTLPLPGAANDGRPKALQIETSAIKVKNSPLNELLDNSSFSLALQAVKEGWLFTSQDSGQFPHLDQDLRALPRRLQELLQQEVRPGRRRGESLSDDTMCSSTGLAPAANKAEMVTFEGWHISTSCVHVAFASSYTHSATLHTKSFISDFPLHVWLFLPPSPMDSTHPSPLDSTHPSPLDSAPPPTPSSTPVVPEPKFSLIAHVPSEIRVELERLQLLFLLRLKDSFTAFKTTLMKFLDPDTFAPNLKKTLEAHRVSSPDATPPATISGCIAVSQVEASILLPTLYTSRTQPSSRVTTPPPREDHSEDPLTTPSKEGPRPQMASSTLQPSQRSPNLPRANISPYLAENSPGRPSSSPTTSQSSLTGTGSQTGMTSSPSPSGSLASLPMILEEQGSRSREWSREGYASTSHLQTAPAGPAADPGRAHTLPPTRAYSAVELAPHLDPLRSSLPQQDSLPNHNESRTDQDSLNDHNQNRADQDCLPGQDGIAKEQTDCITPTQQPLINHSPVSHTRSPGSAKSVDDFVMVKYPHTSSSGDVPRPPTISSGDVSRPPTSSSDSMPRPPVFPSPHIHIEESSVSSVPQPSASAATVTPAVVSPPSSRSSVTSPTLSTSSKGTRRQKSPAPMRTVPLFVLHAHVQHVFALPCIQAGEITMKISADTVTLRELSAREHQGMKELQQRRKPSTAVLPCSPAPCIKARFEIGGHVGRWYPSTCAEEQDAILIGKAEGLDLSLLLPNITVMKDFFDDELESLYPLPMHLKVASTRAVLLEDLAHSADHAQSMSIAVEQLEVHRGRELKQTADVFMDAIPRYACMYQHVQRSAHARHFNLTILKAPHLLYSTCK